MLEGDNLDILIKEEFLRVYAELDTEQKKYFNHRSIKNIIYHLIDHPKDNPKRNKKLQELGEIRIKKKLLEYLKAYRSTEFNKDSAYSLYDSYFYEIGQFMSNYYGFSSLGGPLMLIMILIFAIFGGLLDALFLSLDWIIFPMFSPMFIVLIVARRSIKYFGKRLYDSGY
ncbi:hypothetical protein [Winogradskyella tangerina]|uniref:hypothetical protein n=1 Tax=Winogradskyella tangerina TaxID=2023240 RepID=UPI000DBE4A7F|nr:hypothetical protein [Winogradskyella tangerina]